MRELNARLDKSIHDRRIKFDKAEKRIRQALKGWSAQVAQIFLDERVIRKVMCAAKVA
jgi:hypothetical protein